MTQPPEILLRAEHISKRFGHTQALDDVSVSFLRGEVHALMGENGAGKSTLGKVIAGLHKQDSGTVSITAPGSTTPTVIAPGSLKDAFHAGVRIVHQELAQCPNMTVAENLALHDMPRSKLGLVDFRAMHDRAASLVHRLDPSIDVEAPLGTLAPGRRQICQIAASLEDSSHKGGVAPRLIVFDEPTSSLSVAEADRLIEIARHLASEGLTIVYVSHRMGEIFAVSDRVTVLRDGKFVATTATKSLDEPTLIEQMIGRRIETAKRGEFSKVAASDAAPSTAPPHTSTSSTERLRVTSVSSPGKLKNISLAVRQGEIVGIGGLVGCGRSELLNAIFGLDKAASGSIAIENKPIALGDSKSMIAAGVGYVPEDRRLQGLFFLLGVGENIVMPFMERLSVGLGLRALFQEQRTITEKVTDYRVKAASTDSLPGELSGGNQQKLLLARWMGKSTRVLLLDEPTRGIDVGTKAEVYKLIRRAADEGTAVLLVSSEMPELLALSDRVLVMCEGRISGELHGSDMTQANILRLATEDSRTPAMA